MTFYVRQQLLVLICFFSSLSYSSSQDPYHVSIVKSASSLRMSFKKGEQSVFDITLPYAKTGFYDLGNLSALEPYAQYFHKTGNVDFILDEPENKCRLCIALDGTITLSELNVQNPFSLKVDGNQTSVLASNTLIAHSDFELIAPSTCCFKSDVSAQWEIGGKASFILPQAVFKLHTALRARNDVEIEAQAFELAYGETTRQKTGRSLQYFNDGKPEKFEDFAFTKKHPRALIESKTGTVAVAADRANLDGGALIAQKDIRVTYKQSLTVTPHCNEHVFHKAHFKKGWFSDEYVTNRNFSLLCDVAVISAGNDIILTHNGKTCIFNNKHVPCTLGNLLNEGLIAAHAYVQSTGSHEGSYYVSNTLPEGPIALPSFQAQKISLKNCIEKATIAKKQANTERFMFVPPLNPTEEAVRPFNEFAFLIENNQSITGNEKALLSLHLQADALSRVLFEATHMPNLPGYRKNDCIELLNHLHDNGFLYALVRGSLHSLENRKDMQQEWQDCSEEEQKAYEELLATFGNPKKLQPNDVKARMLQIKAGTHFLKLSQSELEAAPSSLIYYTLDSFEGQQCLVPILYLTTNDVKENYHLATMTGKDVIIDNASDVINTGVIRSIDKLEIEAKTIVNTKTLTRHFRIKTPLPGGQIIGFDVELSVPKSEAGAGIYNHGGTIFGTQNLSLIADSGNVKNTAIPLGKHTVHLDQEAIHALFDRNHQVIDYYPGRLISGGDMTIVAQAGRFLNEASRIIARGDVHLKSYANVVLKSLVSHTAEQTSHVNGMSFEQISLDGIKVHRSEIHSQGNVFIESTAGQIKDTASSFRGAGFTFKSALGNEFKPLALDISLAKAKTGFDTFSFGHVVDTVHTRGYAQTTFENTGKLEFDSALDNVFQAVIFTNDNEPIHIVAARDNVFKGAKKLTNIQSDGWSFGVSFFGSKSIQALENDDIQGAAWYLVNEDPLLAALLALKESSNAADKVANSTYSTIEALRLFLAYEEQAKTSQHPAIRVLGQRLGLTDDSGKFNPRMLWRLGTVQSHEHSTSNLKTVINGSQVELKSGNQLLLLDGTEIHAHDVTIDAKEVHGKAARDEYAKGTTTLGMTFGNDGSLGVDASYTQEDSTSYNNVKINAGNFTLRAENVHCHGCRVNVTNADINVKKELDLASVSDTRNGFTAGASVLDGASTIAAAFNYHKRAQKTIREPSGIHASKHLNVLTDTLNLNGAYITSDDPDARVQAKNIYHEDIDGYSESSSINLSNTASTQGSDILGIRAIVDARLFNESQDEKTRATIDKTMLIITEDDLSKINRDRAQIHAVDPIESTVYRAVIPIVDREKFKKGLDKVKTVLSHNEPITADIFDKLIEELGIQKPTEAEKEAIAQIINKLESDDTNKEPQEPEKISNEQTSSNNDSNPTNEQKEASYSGSETCINGEKLTVEELSLGTLQQKDDQLVAHVEHNPDGTITITYKGKSAILKVSGTINYFDQLLKEFDDILKQSGLTKDKSEADILKLMVTEREILTEHFRQRGIVCSFLLDLVPVVGDIKAAYQTLTDKEASLKTKLAVLGLLAIPHARSIGKTVKWCAYKILKSLKSVKKVKTDSIFKRLSSFATNVAKTGYIKKGSQVVDFNTRAAAEKVANFFKGTIKEAKNGKGWVVAILKDNRKIEIRLMDAGSGMRPKPYFRVTVPKSALTIEGKLSNKPKLTHIELTENYFEQIQNIVKKC